MASDFKPRSVARQIKFDAACDSYEIRIRPRRNYWWLLLLLLPLLLLIRCERDIVVVTVDEKDRPIDGVATSLSYDARFLWKDSSLLPVEPQYRELTTGDNGRAVYKGLPCSVFSYIFAPLSRVTATGDRYPYTAVAKDALFHFTREIKLVMNTDTLARDVDIVMVIDNTGSMDEVEDAVKKKALSLYDDLIAHCKAVDKPLRKVRMKFISYGDFADSDMVESELFALPGKKHALARFIKDLTLTDGGDNPENSLEALSRALDTPWTTDGNIRRHIIVLVTDAETLPLGERSGSPHYPAGMAADMASLRAAWDRMDPAERRLIIFAPDDDSWTEVKSWPQTENISRPVYDVISTEGFDAVLKIISNSL